MKFNFQVDPDTQHLLETVVWCLERFFGYTENDASATVIAYFLSKNQEAWIDDDFYHHEGPYGVALRSHYVQGLKLGSDREDTFYNWARQNGYYNPPREAMQRLVGEI